MAPTLADAVTHSILTRHALLHRWCCPVPQLRLLRLYTSIAAPPSAFTHCWADNDPYNVMLSGETRVCVHGGLRLCFDDCRARVLLVAKRSFPGNSQEINPAMTLRRRWLCRCLFQKPLPLHRPGCHCGSLLRANTTHFNLKTFDCARTTAGGMTEEGTAIVRKGGRKEKIDIQLVFHKIRKNQPPGAAWHLFHKSKDNGEGVSVKLNISRQNATRGRGNKQNRKEGAFWSLYGWIGPPVHAHKKTIPENTRTSTIISRPLLERSWRGESRSAWTIFEKSFLTSFFKTSPPRIEFASSNSLV